MSSSIRQPDKAAPTTFLSLPLATHLRVYNLAGLFCSCPISLNTLQPHWPSCVRGLSPSEREQASSPASFARKKPKAGDDDCPSSLECNGGGFPLNLLYVSRQLHKEVEALQHGRNTFRLVLSETSGFEAVSSVSVAAFNAVRRLRVQLLCRPLEAGYPSDRECEICEPHSLASTEPRSVDEPVRCQVDSSIYLEPWKRLCKRLAQRAPAQELDIDFVADCNELNDTTALAALLKLLKRVRRASVRLSQSNHWTKYAALTREALWQMTSPQSRGMPARFPRYLELPHELQLRILACTELSTWA